LCAHEGSRHVCDFTLFSKAGMTFTAKLFTLAMAASNESKNEQNLESVADA
jgi:hypothetical protein